MTQQQKQCFWIKTQDYHTAGEPFRIVPSVPSHLVPPSTLSIPNLRRQILSTPNHPLDLLRRSLCHEPRGHADMYGCFVFPPSNYSPSSTEAHFGVLFWHKDGFSTACGHGTIALGVWAVENGIVERKRDGEVKVFIDVPSGLVTAVVNFRDGEVEYVDFINVASYQFAKDMEVILNNEQGERKREVKADLAWGGAVLVFIDATDFGVKIEMKNYQRFIDLAREMKIAIGEKGNHKGDSSYGVCFFEHVSSTPQTMTQKNVVVFADGQIDRSPCGSGTCARVAVLTAQGHLKKGMKLIHESIIGTKFESWDTSEEGGGQVEMKEGFPVVWPKVRGIARVTGRHEFCIDERDDVYPGFVFR